jgi:hypothetical protein
MNDDAIAHKYAVKFLRDCMKEPQLDNPFPHAASTRPLFLDALVKYFSNAIEESKRPSNLP